MARPPIEIDYAKAFPELEKVLRGVTRPGEVFASGKQNVALPLLTVKGAGQIAFPVPAAQAKQIAQAAPLAPYGRGTETVLDTSVRKVRQLVPGAVKISGKGWEASLADIVDQACEGLGCAGKKVSAELYKLLIYETEGFFLSHRDTEKTPGMFGTLVVSLPSAHKGGDLLIRHEGAEHRVSLVSDEPSEVAWAAFYADCEHEVKPVTKGFRVCLVYNLIQHTRSRARLGPPDLAGPAKAAARLIGEAFRNPDARVKLAKERMTEATGNEGASFERSYHRAAIVLWPSSATAEVLLQAGPPAATPYLKKQVDALVKSKKPDVERRRGLLDLARRMIDDWRSYERTSWRQPDDDARRANRTTMLEALNRLGDGDLIAAFIQQVIEDKYDGSENQALCESAALLSPETAATSFDILIRSKLPERPQPMVKLFALLASAASKHREFFRRDEVIAAVCSALPKLTPPADPYAFQKRPFQEFYSWDSERQITPKLLAQLIAALETLCGPDAAHRAVETMLSHPKVFDPLLLLTPALKALLGSGARKTQPSPAVASLWKHCAESLLSRSATPPAPPADWSQPVNLKCKCEDCQELQAFSADPVEQVHRFRVNKDRRRHLHDTIESRGLDMTHVTERIGSPLTLVCTKTRKRFALRSSQYAADLVAFKTLLSLARAAGCGADPAVALMKQAGTP